MSRRVQTHSHAHTHVDTHIRGHGKTHSRLIHDSSTQIHTWTHIYANSHDLYAHARDIHHESSRACAYLQVYVFTSICTYHHDVEVSINQSKFTLNLKTATIIMM